MTEIVAEISGNHGGSLYNALCLIREAKAAGADAVKFQCFEPRRLAAKRSKHLHVVLLAKEFHGLTLLELYDQIHTPKDWFPVLRDCANSEGLPWFSSVFDPDDVAFLETLHCPRYKISAFEMLDGDLINAVVTTGKPIVLSVRPTDGVTILRATSYDGTDSLLGLSDHSPEGAAAYLMANAPMVERHLRLPDVPCQDEAFSSTPQQFRAYVDTIKGRT